MWYKIIVLMFVLLLAGCTGTKYYLPVNVVSVPAGTSIGKYETKEDGIYMTDEAFSIMVSEIIRRAEKDNIVYW